MIRARVTYHGCNRHSFTSLSGDRAFVSVRQAPLRKWNSKVQSESTSSTTTISDPFATKETYSDSDLLSKFMIWFFSKTMSEQLGGVPYDSTYDGFVELSRQIMKGRNTKEQQETVANILASLLPPQVCMPTLHCRLDSCPSSILLAGSGALSSMVSSKQEKCRV